MLITMGQLAVLIAIFSAVCIPRAAADTRGDRCLRSLTDFQVSILDRPINLISLQSVFYPCNRQSSISFTVKYYLCSNSTEGSSLSCSDVERWVADLNSGRVPSVDYSANYTYKFGWHASPINLFIRPALLAILSVQTFRIDVQTAHIILDPICQDTNTNETPITPGHSGDVLEICNSPTPPIEMLNQLTQDLKSFVLHKGSYLTHGTKAELEQGHSIFYFNPGENEDFCVLHYTEAYETKRKILAAAIIISLFFVLFTIPFLAYHFYNPIMDALEKDHEKVKHYYVGFTVTIGLFGVITYILDLVFIFKEYLAADKYKQSVISDVNNYYISGLVFLILVPLILNPIIVISLEVLQVRLSDSAEDKCCKCCCSVFGCTVFIYVFVAELFSFHAVYMLMGIVAAPIVTGSLLLFYFANMFLLTMSFALMSRGIAYIKGNGPKDSTDKEKAFLVCKILMVIFLGLLFLAGISLYLAFYYKMIMLVQPYSNGSGFLSSFGSLLPSILTFIAGLLEKRLMEFLEKRNAQTDQDGTKQGYEKV